MHASATSGRKRKAGARSLGKRILSNISEVISTYTSASGSCDESRPGESGRGASRNPRDLIPSFVIFGFLHVATKGLVRYNNAVATSTVGGGSRHNRRDPAGPPCTDYPPRQRGEPTPVPPASPLWMSVRATRPNPSALSGERAICMIAFIGGFDDGVYQGHEG